MPFKLSTLTRAITIALLFLFVAICVCFIPNFSTYLCKHLGNENLSPFIFGYGILLCLPCVFMLLGALRFSELIEADCIFTETTALLLARISLVLLVDCAMFLVGIVALFIVGEFTISPLLALVCLIGLALSVLLHMLSGYIRRAAALKEEADATL